MGRDVGAELPVWEMRGESQPSAGKWGMREAHWHESQPSAVPATVDIWGMNQKMRIFSISLSL